MLSVAALYSLDGNEEREKTIAQLAIWWNFQNDSIGLLMLDRANSMSTVFAALFLHATRNL